MKNKNKLSVGLLTRVSFTKFNPVHRNKKAADEYAAAHGADASMHNSTMRLVHKKFVDPLQQVETAVRAMVEQITLPWEDRGNRLLPADAVPRYQDELAKLRLKWDQAVDDFCGEWDRIVADARLRLNGDFRESHYPSGEAVRTKFRMVVTFMPMPDNDQLIGSIRDEMEEVFNERMVAAARDLRERLVDKLQHLAARCGEVGGEEGRRFYSSNVTNVLELCELLPSMLIGDDPDLMRAIADARQMLDGIDADAIKSSQLVASDIRRKAEAIVGSLL